MNLPLFLARKIDSADGGRKKLPPAIRIAMTGVALGMAIMILSVAIVIGFKNEIRDKMVGFGSHIQITNMEDNSSFETSPIAIPDSLVEVLQAKPFIQRTSLYATKPGILKTEDEFAGIVLKGVTPSFDWEFYEQHLLEGELPLLNDSTSSSEVIVSRMVANQLHLKVGDRIFCYFVQEGVKARRYTITGIYETNFTDYDKLFVVGDVRNVQRLNNWESDQYSGIEILLHSYDNLQHYTDELYFELSPWCDRTGELLFVQSIEDVNPQLFSWLDLLDLNVWVILVLMSLVAGFTMISGLLIIILERTNMIGVLKALGASNATIRHTFLHVALFLVGRGMLWGNVLGIGLSLVQGYGKVITLDPSVYYLSSVPIELNGWYILLLNIGSLVISMLMLIAPSYLISRIHPAKSIKFE